MLKNYFKTAYRNLLRNKSYAAINIAGLTIGIAACLLLFLVIRFELSFDNFHGKKDNIYRVVTEFNSPEGKFYSTGVPFPVPEGLRIDFPQLQKVAAIFTNGNDLITVPADDRKPPQKYVEERGVYFAETSFFDIFDFPWLSGTAKSALGAPNSVVLTRETAERYFGSWKAALGKTIKYDNRDLLKVTGILENPPVNTDFPLKMVISYPSLKNTGVSGNLTDWVSTYSESYCFILLPPASSPSAIEKQLVNFQKKHKPAEYADDRLLLQPLADMHFDNRYGNYNGRTFGRDLIGALTLIGIFLLIIACVNFINLATAQAVNRSREVGVRKVLGSDRLRLRAQFMTETAIITISAILFAGIVSAAVIPFVNDLLRIQVRMNLFTDPELLLFLLLLAIAVTFLSGFYPAMILSGFNPITALKSKVTSKMVGGISLRRGLVVLQFSIAQVLIIGMLVVVTQMNYFRNASLGFNKDAVILVPIPNDSVSTTRMDALRNDLKAHPAIKNVSFSFASPSDNGSWNSDFKFDHAPKSTDFGANLKWADTAYFRLFGLEFVAGRPYFQSDTVREFVVNETLVRKLGFKDPEQVIGKEMNFWDGNRVGPIVGVVKDFHVNSLRDPISAVAMSTWKNVYRTICIKLDGSKTGEALAFVEKKWNASYPDFFYQYQFLDEKISDFYRQENQLSTLYKIFAGIAIFISCLGLYGLISFMAAQRTKEVGIRKVLGASVVRIVYLFSKEFTLLIGVAFVIAAPVAYFIMKKWLQNFTFRIEPGLLIFICAIAGSILIAWVTVGYRAVKAALANPVRSLRME